MSHSVQNIYSFFNEFKTYVQYDTHVENNYGKEKFNNTCHAFLTDISISSTETANHICKKFKNFYKFIFLIRENQGRGSLDDADFAYLNYWINTKLRNNRHKHNITVKKFHQNMSFSESEFAGYDMFEGKLFDIRENDFQNIELLINLENQYVKIYQNVISREGKEKISCSEYYKAFADKYKEGIRICPDDTNFCNSLNIYQKKYENFTDPKTIAEKCIDEDIPELPTYNDISLRDKKITVVGSILGPSLGTLFTMLFLYKFTPIYQWIHSKMRKTNEAHSKIYDEYDQSLLNTSDSEHKNIGNNAYLMSYDSIVNS
ncbi:PIR protein [Plasmodium ovale]|uniref:PIR Superfamily Protein n=2 Tax=Plasmodium ovale TaxID=36330 RepID=A0A1A8X2N1_PLAOA|nr:PIR Superfamily Protein [Plasmodium ovale curtisi]SBT84658.1 PIR protein [Plasmodium ovale]